MRTNSTSFALTVGMALLIVLMGFGVLSAAGLVGFAASRVENEPALCGNVAEPIDSTTIVSVPMSAEATAGKALFEANCVQCHAVNEKVVGPALAGITKRRRASWVVAWVRNPAKVIASGDEYAAKLFNDYGKQQMPSFGLSDKEIKAIITYVAASSGDRVVVDYAPVAVK